MSDKLTLAQWLANEEKGAYRALDVQTQIEAGWYDWFCRDESLAGKTRKLAPKVRLLAESAKVNKETMYVFFKNNCPLDGTLYDDFRFCDLATGNVVYCVTPATGHRKVKGRAEVWGRENNFDEPLVVGTWADVKKFFGV